VARASALSAGETPFPPAAVGVGVWKADSPSAETVDVAPFETVVVVAAALVTVADDEDADAEVEWIQRRCWTRPRMCWWKS